MSKKSGVNNKIAITNQDTIVITSEFYSTEIENFQHIKTISVIFALYM